MSEQHALPQRPLPRGLRNWRAPPAWRRAGCPHLKPSPAHPAQRARRGLRDADTASPRFRGPGPARCARTGLGPGPGARTAPGKHLLCTEPGKLSPSLVAFMAADRGPGRRWGGGTGLHGRGLFLYFSTLPRLPSPNSGGGRTDVKRAPLPLPRGRSARRPGPAAKRLQGAAHQSRTRRPRLRGVPRDLGGGCAREGRADTGGRPVPTPAALRSGPMRLASPAPAPLHLPPWAPGPRGGPAAAPLGRGVGWWRGPPPAAVLGGRCCAPGRKPGRPSARGSPSAGGCLAQLVK